MSETIKYQKLTPNTDIDLKGYDKAFDFVFKNNDVKNIAISGPYGSGKSSLIESYKKTSGKKYSFMRISLAHFRGNENDETGEEFPDDAEKDSPKKLSEEAVLEGKIINQLIHQVPSEKIEQTSFKVKNKINIRDIISIAALIFLFVFSLVLIMFSTQLEDWTNSFSDGAFKILLSSVFGRYNQLAAGMIVIAASSLFIFKLVKAQKYKNLFKKINVNGNEIEIFENQDDSYFDKYLNEILYLFENVEQDVVVFEDLDRYDSVEIFERLHEINDLINIKKADKPIRFFYLIRDDMFLNKDRTKFFDFIIPVVPVIDSSNSYAQLISFLKDGNVYDGLNDGFLQGLSLYIDDMRILKNICNEYIIYLSKINITELNKDKMLAMITYKNLFPKDFSELQFGRGFVHEVMSSKNMLIESLIKECEEKKQKLQGKITAIQKETLQSTEELDIVLNSRLDHISIYDSDEQNRTNQIFKERKKALNENKNESISNLEGEIQKLDIKENNYSGYLLKDLITRKNITTLFSVSSANELGEPNNYKEVKRSNYFDLLKFLIREGYIDETYCDYMSYFYEGGICANDKIYLRRITDQRGRAFDIPLVRPDVILSNPIIRSANFEQEETLNFDLLVYLLAHRDNETYKTYLSVLIKQIKENEEYDFVSQFYNTSKSRIAFVKEINTQWPDFFGIILEDEHFTDEQVKSFSLETLYYCSYSVIKEVNQINQDNVLTTYISSNGTYLEIDDPDISTICSVFGDLGVSFASIDYEKSNKDLFDMVYEYGFYDISYENIRLMLIIQHHVNNEDDIKHKMATLILSDEDTPLEERMKAEIADFVKVIVEYCEGNITDEQNIAVMILNSETIDIDLREKYISYLSTEVTELSSVENKNLWTAILDRKNAAYSADNIVRYFESFGMIDTLINFFNSSDSEADFSDVSNSFNQKTIENFFNAVVSCNAISTVKYKSALPELGVKLDDFDVPDIDEDKMRVLIDESIIVFNAENMEFIREHYQGIRYQFIRHNIAEYIDLQSQVYDYDETEALLSMDINEEEKIQLIEYVNDPLSVAGKNYSDRIMAAIITDHFCESDAQSLFETYGSYSDDVQNAIYNAALGRIRSITNYERKIDFALLARLVSGDMDFGFKIALFDYSLKFINEEECKILFNGMGYEKLGAIFEPRSRKRYDNTNEIKKILDTLKRHTWIANYHVTNDNPQKLTVVKTR